MEVVVYANYIGLCRFYRYVVNIGRWSLYEGGQLDRFHCSCFSSSSFSHNSGSGDGGSGGGSGLVVLVVTMVMGWDWDSSSGGVSTEGTG